jgi:hypothetical protein
MSLNNALLLMSGDDGVTDSYKIYNSLRFRQSASAYLSRTPSATATSNTKFTWSGWVKRGLLGQTKLFGASTSSNNVWYAQITDNVTDALTFGFFNGANAVQVTTTQLFRDISAWYHIVIAYDSTQATASNRVLIYINGVQVTSFATATYPTLNQTMFINASTIDNYIGTAQGTIGTYDGYMSEVYMIDGQALTPSSFGAANSITGIWRPKAYTGTYGTNGFYLNFADNSALTTSSNVGLGKDNSGNGNFLVTNNISITAGTTYDSMTDVPTLTSATVANYATFNPLKMPAPASVSYTDGNLFVSCANANQTPALATIYPSSGKWYWEVTWTSGSFARIGVQNTTVASTDFAADTAGWRWESNTGNIYNGSILSTVSTYATGDVLGLCLDCDSGKLYVAKNGTWQNSAVPASGTGAVATNIPTGTLMSPAVATGSGTSVFAINFGQRPFTYTPPAGFVALNTFNLPNSTIVKGNTVMDATTYTGTGASLSVTNTSAFKPDLVWVKGRSGATDHALYDSVRGTTKDLVSNSTAAETTQATGLTAFGTSGFTVDTLAKMNTNAATYVGWQWQAGQGSTSSNTQGSITSTVSVNASAGFSIVTYTGTGANATVGHGLGVAPKMVIVKGRSAASTDWMVYHASSNASPATGVLQLNTTIAFTATSTTWNNTAPTSSVFSVGTNNPVNQSSQTFVAYCWAEIAGFSKFGSYTGNGSSDGVFVYTGFRPKYVMIKRTDAVNDWYLYDSSRNPYNTSKLILFADTSGAEATSTTSDIDFVSNGFKIRGTDSGINASGGAYIYAAFAENPFKYALAR